MTLFGIFVPGQPEIHREALRAFANGLKQRLIAYELFPLDAGYRPCDVIVTFGVEKHATQRGRALANLLEEHFAQLGDGPSRREKHLVIERGFLRRDEYFMVGWDGLNGRANFFNQRCSDNRWRKLKISVAPWRSAGRHIVLCGQVPWDASVQDANHVTWCRDTAQQLASLTDRPIVFRPHPLQPKAVDMTGCPVTFSTKATLDEDLIDAWAVVTYNSNAGVEATVAGVPAFAADPGAMGYPILNHDLRQIEAPATPRRAQWLKNLAYTQWTLEEIARGLTIEHLWCKQRFPKLHWWNLLTRRYPSHCIDRVCEAWEQFERFHPAADHPQRASA